MGKSNSVLLVFDDLKEEQFFETHLAENNFTILKSKNLHGAFILVKEFLPDLVVVNIPYTNEEISIFSKKIKTELSKKIQVLCLIESPFSENSKKGDHYYINKAIRPKVSLSIIRNLMNKEDVRWLPALQ